MLVSSTEVSGAADALEELTPQAAAAPAEAPSTEVLISTQQVAFSTAVALGASRESDRGRFVARVRRMWTAPSDERPRPSSYPKRYGFLEQSLMAREMDRL